MDLQTLLFNQINQRQKKPSDVLNSKVDKFCEEYVHKISKNKQLQSLGRIKQSFPFIQAFIMHLIDGYQLSVKLEVNHVQKIILITAQLVKENLERVYLGSNDICLLLLRLFNIFNSVQGTSSVFLAPSEKIIKIKHCSAFTSQQFSAYIQKPEKMVKYIDEQITEMRNKMKSLLPQILFLTNQQQPGTFDRKYEESLAIDRKKYLDQIQVEFQKISHLQNTKDRCDSYNRTPCKGMEISEVALECSQKANAILCFYNKKPCEYQKQEISPQQLQKYWIHPEPRPINPQDRVEILNCFQYNQANSRWDPYEQTRFSKIFLGNITFRYLPLDPGQTDSTRYLIRKTKISGSEGNTNRTQNQFKILNKIRDCKCNNINRYLYRQNTVQNEIFSDYCSFKSLERYKDSYKQTMSLLTKVFILCHTVQGVRFLGSKQIIHCDIKPGNILLARNLTAKLCDFGDSRIAGAGGISTQPLTAVTPMFSPPEVCSENGAPTATKNLDTYGIGMVMYELLFSKFPFQLMSDKLPSDRYCGAMTKIPPSERISVVPERIGNSGPNDLMESLARLCFLCLRDDEKKRPSLDSVIVILRLSMIYLTKIFS